MSTTIDTFIYLKRDIEQSFQRVQKIYNSSQHDQQELDQLFNHISCTLDDLQKVNQLLHSSSTLENQSVNIPLKQNTPLLNLSENENDFQEENTKFITEKRNTQISIKDQTQKHFSVGYTKENEEPLLSSNSNTTTVLLPSSDEREDFIGRMKTEFVYYKNKFQQTKKEPPMEIIRLDQAPEENEDQIIREQDEQLEGIHHSIVSLKNLTQNINFEINDHIRVLDNLETGMINSQNRVENLTNRTKTFIRTSGDGVGGHTCLFILAVGLFFLIVILILFF
jgi:syntaxin 8